ncbi:MAG: alpha/beta fold hydrolase [Chloroflexi bacterium]|nr:alpha/beta fold hydrolase [Chloroflexota bacterium]
MRFFYRNKLIRYIVLGVVLLVFLAIAGGGWYFSGILEADGLQIDNEPPEFKLTITAIGDGTITLQQLPDMDEEENLAISAKWGVTDGEDYGQLGDVLSDSNGLVTREFTLMAGGFLVGQPVYLDRTAYPHDPGSAYGLDYREVLIPGPIGSLGAWYIPPASGTSDVWAVLVHGRTGNRDDSIKLLDDLAALGVHSLTIDYRNDEGAPSSKSGYYDFGVTEWEDLEAATSYALDNGASKIVLIGHSMGGGIVVNYQLQSDLADRTVGLILDSPMLNFGRTVDKGAEERSVPPPITFAAKLISTLRFGIDWGAMDFLSPADELTVPILLFHGDTDDTVPVETSLEFAEKLPELVELHTFADTNHVAAWNLYTDEYESLVRDFIERIR